MVCLIIVIAPGPGLIQNFSSLEERRKNFTFLGFRSQRVPM